jgi:hypothetical protein
MSRPIPDKAEVALELPDKFYIGPSSDQPVSISLAAI